MSQIIARSTNAVFCDSSAKPPLGGFVGTDDNYCLECRLVVSPMVAMEVCGQDNNCWEYRLVVSPIVAR